MLYQNSARSCPGESLSLVTGTDRMSHDAGVDIMSIHLYQLLHNNQVMRWPEISV